MARKVRLTAAEAEARLDQERLKAEFEYDPNSGVFTRVKKFHGLARLGPVGSVGGEGYMLVSCRGYQYLAHRLVWLYVHGEWPAKDIDHRNLDRSDNRLENLRPADRGQNMRNVGLLKSNTSGYRGVDRHRGTGRWRARTYINNVCHNLGYYDTKEAAAEVVDNFTSANFGEFKYTPKKEEQK